MPRIYYKDTSGVERPCEVLNKNFDSYRIKYKTKEGDVVIFVTKDQLIFPKFSELVV